jgi:hypothetical protein
MYKGTFQLNIFLIFVSQVSKEFNVTCGQLLTCGLHLAEKETSRLKSELAYLLLANKVVVRNYQLRKKWRILGYVQMNLITLRGVFMDHVMGNECPFIPGKVGLSIYSLCHLVSFQIIPYAVAL